MHGIKRRLPHRFAAFPAILGLLAAVFFPASANASISNGTFESETGTSITGWTAMNQQIDLGATSIAGCTTVDTSDYTTLRDYDSEWLNEYSGVSPAIDRDPSVNNDSLSLTWRSGDAPTDPGNLTTEVLNVSSGDFARSGNVLKLSSDVYADNFGGYVIHGPAVYSDTFTAKTIDDLTIDWGASDDSDYYHVFGYLLNTATCEQTEVIDSTGEKSLWQTQTVAIPSNGTYRFVFVSGTYDKSFGKAAGAILYLDNILLTVNEERAAEEAAAAAAASNQTPAAPQYPRLDSYSLTTDSSGAPELRIEGKRFTCIEKVVIDGTELPFASGFSTTWSEYLTIDITGVSPGTKTLVLESCLGKLVHNDWVVISQAVEPKSTWMKAQSFGLNEAMRSKIASFNSSLGDGYYKIRCIVNSANGEEMNRAFAKQICAFAQSNDLWQAGVVHETKATFTGRGYWVNIWASGGYN